MITLQTGSNEIKFEKQIGTVTQGYAPTSGSYYHIITWETLANDSGSAGITYTTASDESNPRWTQLEFSISSSTEYANHQVYGLPGTTYDLEIWYSPLAENYVWGTYNKTWSGATIYWAQPGGVNYDNITANSVLKFKDRIFVSSSVAPHEIIYNSPNEVGRFIVYQG